MSLKRLQEETGTKMSILGKGSMRDKSKVCILNGFNVFHDGLCCIFITTDFDLKIQT